MKVRGKPQLWENLLTQNSMQWMKSLGLTEAMQWPALFCEPWWLHISALKIHCFRNDLRGKLFSYPKMFVTSVMGTINFNLERSYNKHFANIATHCLRWGNTHWLKYFLKMHELLGHLAGSVGLPTLDFGSSGDLGVLRSRLKLGSMLGVEPAYA